MLIAPKIEPTILDGNLDTEEAGIEVWATDTSYTLNTIVQVSGGKRLYKALQAVPENINPLDDVNEATSYGEYWYDIGATNYYRAFDEKGSSVTSNADEIYYKFQVSDVDVLMLKNIQATEVQIKVTNVSTGIVIQDVTIDTTVRDVYDWFDWTYNTPEQVTTTGALLQMAYDATLEVWLRNNSSVASVGHIVYGRGQNVGLTLADPAPTVSHRGVTSKTRNDFGDIVTRSIVRYERMTVTCYIKANTIDQIQNRLEKFVDKPLVLVGDPRENGFNSLAIFGEIKDHDMPIGVVSTKYQLEVEGYI